jgi:hypothetical protein
MKGKRKNVPINIIQIVVSIGSYFLKRGFEIIVEITHERTESKLKNTPIRFSILNPLEIPYVKRNTQKKI